MILQYIGLIFHTLTFAPPYFMDLHKGKGTLQLFFLSKELNK